MSLVAGSSVRQCTLTSSILSQAVVHRFLLEHIIGLGSKEQSWDTKPTLRGTLYKDFSQWELATFPWASQMLEKGA